VSALAYAPLLPIAAAVTIGLVVDRYEPIPIVFSIGAAILCLIGWAVCRRQKREQLALLYLWAVWAGLACAYHHSWRHLYSSDDIGEFANDQPTLIQVRGTIVEEPTTPVRRKDDPLVSQPRTDTTQCVVEVFELRREGDWQAASGKTVLQVSGKLDGLHVGDDIEFTGWIARPQPPMNPGEWDYSSKLQDRRIRAAIHVKSADHGVVRLAEGWRGSFFGWLAQIRGWGERTLLRELPADQAGIAIALLLGESSAMASEDWEKYVRTGVIHVLAISGQHLVVLGAFLWFLFRLIGVRARRAAWLVAAIMLAYALLTGGRPSAMRAAVMVGAVCVGIIARRPALPANTFALAWLVVLALNPTDLFTAGFQLSFLCVAVLIWGIPRWFPKRERTPLQQLIEESRPGWQRIMRAFLRVVGWWYLVSLVLTAATAPLVIWWQNVVAPSGALIGPPLILLTSIALVAGFLTLLLSLIGSWAALPFTWITRQSIGLCEWIVGWADRLPGGCFYVPDIPIWWLAGFYGMLLVWMCRVRFVNAPPLAGGCRFAPLLSNRSVALALTTWLCTGLILSARQPSSDELRITFIYVGHGTCVLLETPDGRVLLYDAGALSGPDVTRRHIAPFLWSRGIHRIDEIFLSHGDLDHFNGVPALARRFTIGRIAVTPSFEQKNAPGVRAVLERIRNLGIVIRQTHEGDLSEVGDVRLKVLHPPLHGPEGLENARSLVMLIEHRGHRILLTGDLEKSGLRLFLNGTPPKVDVLMAPHHGGASANTAELADKTKPRLVIACDGPKSAPPKGDDVYTKRKIPYWVTWPHGAITLRSHATGLTAETYRTGQRLVVVSGSTK
jgi:competence protein ComEC